MLSIVTLTHHAKEHLLLHMYQVLCRLFYIHYTIYVFLLTRSKHNGCQAQAQLSEIYQYTKQRKSFNPQITYFTISILEDKLILNVQRRYMTSPRP